MALQSGCSHSWGTYDLLAGCHAGLGSRRKPGTMQIIKSTSNAIKKGQGRDPHLMHPAGCEETAEIRGYRRVVHPLLCAWTIWTSC